MSAAKVGVAVVAHGDTASHLLEAAQGILGDRGDFDGVVAVDAGLGETPRLGKTLCNVLDTVDRGRGVVVLVDLLGASPCQCATREGASHGVTVLSGLNLAMLLKVGSSDRARLSAIEVAQACADSAQRAVQVTGLPDSTSLTEAGQ